MLVTVCRMDCQTQDARICPVFASHCINAVVVLIICYSECKLSPSDIELMCVRALPPPKRVILNSIIWYSPAHPCFKLNRCGVGRDFQISLGKFSLNIITTKNNATFSNKASFFFGWAICRQAAKLNSALLFNNSCKAMVY